MIRPNHNSGPPPGSNGHWAVSIPFGTMLICRMASRHSAAVCPETAANRVPAPSDVSIADSSHGVGGVWTVVSIGVDGMGATATGR